MSYDDRNPRFVKFRERLIEALPMTYQQKAREAFRRDDGMARDMLNAAFCAHESTLAEMLPPEKPEHNCSEQGYDKCVACILEAGFLGGIH